MQHTCTKCKQRKDKTEFYIQRTKRKDGSYRVYRVPMCKVCIQENTRQRRKDSHEYYLERDRAREKTPERQAYHKKHNKEIYAKSDKKQHVKETLEWQHNNPEKYKAITHRYYLKNKPKVLARGKKYANTPKGKEVHLANNLRYHHKKKKDPQYHLRRVLANRVHKLLKGISMSGSTMELVGCSREKLVQHIENQFTKGMTWEYMGEWHIDHKRPCASYDLTKPSQQRACFNYTNLRPMWGRENIIKGAKFKGINYRGKQAKG